MRGATTESDSSSRAARKRRSFHGRLWTRGEEGEEGEEEATEEGRDGGGEGGHGERPLALSCVHPLAGSQAHALTHAHHTTYDIRQSEFANLLTTLNPEVELHTSTLAVITSQVWHEYAAYTCNQGLDEAGFLEIYLSGQADARRDVGYVREAVGRMVKTMDRCLSFVVHVRAEKGVHVEKHAVRNALEQALPDGLRKEVVVDGGVETCGGGRAFGVSCFFSGKEVGRDEFAYVTGMLEMDPKTVFGGHVFGNEVITGLFREEVIDSGGDGGGDDGGESRKSRESRALIEAYRRISVGVMRAAEMMGAVGQRSMAFAVVDEAGDGGAALMAALAGVLPKGAAGAVIDGPGDSNSDADTDTDTWRNRARKADEHVLTIAVRVPSGKVAQAKDAICRVVRRSSAMEEFRERRPVLAFTIGLHDHWRSEVSGFVEDVRRMLPVGSMVGLLSGSAASRLGSDNTIRILAALPKDSMPREVEMIKEAAGSTTGLKDWCRAAEDVRQVAVSDGYGFSSMYSDTSNTSNILTRGTSFGIDETTKRTPHVVVEQSPDDALPEVMSPVFAGYERRSPSESGSSGLVEALERSRIADLDDGVVESKKASGDVPPRVISVNAYMPGQTAAAETPERALKIKTGGGWKGFLKSLSPRKKPRERSVLRDSDRTRRDAGADVVDIQTAGQQVTKPQTTKMTEKTTGTEIAQVVQLPAASTGTAKGLTDESREQAVMKANIAQIVGQVEYAVAQMGVDGAIADSTLESALHASLLLPSWACSAACMKSAEVLIKAGLFEEPRPFLVGATRAMPEDPLAYFRLGYTYFGMNDFDSAARYFYEAIKRCTRQDAELLVKIHINMGIALESMGNLTTAEREYSKAAAMDEAHPRVHKLLGSVRYAIGNYGGAAEALERALKNVPDFADAWTDLGCVRRAVKNNKDAVRCFKMALASDPDNLEAHYNMGVLMRETSKPKESVEHYDCVLDQDPEHSMALLGKAVALSMLADKEHDRGTGKKAAAADTYRKDAATCLRRFLELCDPEDPLAIEVRRLYDMIRADTPSKHISTQLTLLLEDVEASQRMATTPRSVDGTGTPRGELATTPRSPAPSENQSQSQVSCDAHHQKQQIQRWNSEEMDSKLGKIDNTSNKNQSSRSAQVSQSSRSQSLSRSISRSTSMAMEKHPTDRSYDRLCRWHPPARVVEGDFSDELSTVMDASLARDRSVQHILSKLDVPLLQTLQPLTTLTFDALLTATFGARSNQASPTKRVRNKIVREIHFHEFLEMILHLVRSRAPEHLVRGALMTLEHRVLPILDVHGTQHVNFPIIMAMLAMLVDAPGRDRLAHAYRLLMARTVNSTTGESLATKSDVAELMASLMAAFGIDHNRKVLERAASANVRNSAVIMMEKYVDDLEKYWPEYQVLPLLANPLK